jgi:hypothetical protein
MSFAMHQIDLAHVEAMHCAFEKVCDAILLKCDTDNPLAEIIVNKIVAHSKAGEHDADGLAAHVLDELADDAV